MYSTFLKLNVQNICFGRTSSESVSNVLWKNRLAGTNRKLLTNFFILSKKTWGIFEIFASSSIENDTLMDNLIVDSGTSIFSKPQNCTRIHFYLYLRRRNLTSCEIGRFLLWCFTTFIMSKHCKIFPWYSVYNKDFDSKTPLQKVALRFLLFIIVQILARNMFKFFKKQLNVPKPTLKDII